MADVDRLLKNSRAHRFELPNKLNAKYSTLHRGRFTLYFATGCPSWRVVPANRHRRCSFVWRTEEQHV